MIWTTPFKPTRIRCSPRTLGRLIAQTVMLAGGVSSGAGCFDGNPTEFAGHNRKAAYISQQTAQELARELGETPTMLALAQLIPGFAGIYYDAPGSNRMVVAITDANDSGLTAASALDLIRSEGIFRSGSEPEVVVRRAEYSFVDLARHRARLRPHVFAIPGTVSLSVDEEANRIAIGVADTVAPAAVIGLATDLGVPVPMLSFREEAAGASVPTVSDASLRAVAPKVSSSQDSWLTGAVPEGKLVGGYQIGSASGPCTLGFNALMRDWGRDRLKFWMFVTGSHCTNKIFASDDNTDGIFQPVDGDLVGLEFRDRWCDLVCDSRNADAALIYINRTRVWNGVGFAPGVIARTVKRQRECEYVGGGRCIFFTRIDTAKTPLRIEHTRDALDNETLDKVGSKSGWTYGDVSATCVDEEIPYKHPPFDRRMWVTFTCVDRVPYYNDGGDSGGPVFSYDDGRDDVTLTGIHVGTKSGTGLAAPFSRIKMDLGELDPYWRPWPDVEVTISGPTEVCPDVEYRWIANRKGTYHPVEHAWSGALTGDEMMIEGKAVGWLKVVVTDGRDMSARDSIYVTVLGNPDNALPHPDCD